MKEIIIISALTKDRVIGVNNTLPWSLPEDLKRFKELTINNTVIMGRKTFESMGCKSLPNRKNIIITTNRNYFSASFDTNLIAAPSLNFALDISKSDKTYIIGGASIYKVALDKATKLELTLVKKDYEGDRYFPKYEHLLKSGLFKLVNEVDHPLFTFLTYESTKTL